MLASARPHPPPIQPGLTDGGGKDLMGDMMVDIIFKKMKNEKLKKNENFSKKMIFHLLVRSPIRSFPPP